MLRWNIRSARVLTDHNRAPMQLTLLLYKVLGFVRVPLSGSNHTQPPRRMHSNYRELLEITFFKAILAADRLRRQCQKKPRKSWLSPASRKKRGRYRYVFANTDVFADLLYGVFFAVCCVNLIPQIFPSFAWAFSTTLFNQT